MYNQTKILSHTEMTLKDGTSMWACLKHNLPTVLNQHWFAYTLPICTCSCLVYCIYLLLWSLFVIFQEETVQASSQLCSSQSGHCLVCRLPDLYLWSWTGCFKRGILWETKFLIKYPAWILLCRWWIFLTTHMYLLCITYRICNTAEYIQCKILQSE